MHTDLSRLVDEALDDTADFDDAWQRVSQALEAAPDDAALLRLRVRLAEACGEHLQRVADLKRLAEIEPDNRATQLASAVTQHRMAFFCAAQQARIDARKTGEGDENEEIDDFDESDEDSLSDASDVMQADALARLVALAEAQIGDAGFMLELLAAWDEAGVGEPWLRLRLLIQALAATPADTALQHALALHWSELSRVDPAGYEPDQPPPVGFMTDAFGSLHDALLVQRALLALPARIDADPNDLPLLEARARLHAACMQFAEAAADHAALAAAWQSRAAQAGADGRDELLERARAARTEAQRCAGGRAAVVEGYLADMEQAASGISGATREALLDELSGAREVLLATCAEPTEDDRAEIEAIARKIGPQVVGALQFEPSTWLTLSTDELEAPLNEWLIEIDQTLLALGWRHLAWCENPAYRRMFGQQVPTGLWIDEPGTSLAVAATVHTIRLVEIETEFADGLQLVTTASRGKNFMVGGPMMDPLFVNTDLPLEGLSRLHRARVAWRAAEHPAVPALVVRDVEAFADMQERQRVHKLEFRLAHGLSEYEARGLPANRPELLIPAVQRAVRDALDAALKRATPAK